MSIRCILTLYCLCALASEQICAIESIPLYSRVLLENSQVRISDVIGFKGQLIVARVNGHLSSMDSTGMIRWEHQLPNNSRITTLQEYDGAVWLLTADGAMYVVDDAGMISHVPVDDTLVAFDLSADQHSLLCMSRTKLYQQQQRQSMELLYTLPEIRGIPSTFHGQFNGVLMVGTDSGFVYRMQASADELVITKSGRFGVFPIEKIETDRHGWVVSMYDQSIEVDTNFNWQPVYVSVFSVLFPVPSAVKTRVKDRTATKNGYICVLTGTSPYSAQKTRAAHFDSLSKSFRLFHLGGTEAELLQLSCAGVVNGRYYFAGNHGALLVVEADTSRWVREPASTSDPAWQVYRQVGNEILMCRSESDSSISWASIADQEETPSIHRVRGVGADQISDVYKLGDRIFIGMRHSFVIADTTGSEVVRSPKYDFTVSFTKYAVDTSTNLVWGCAARFVYCWNIQGELIDKKAYDSLGLPFNLAVVKDGVVLLGNGISTVPIYRFALESNRISIQQLDTKFPTLAYRYVGTIADRIVCVGVGDYGEARFVEMFLLSDFSRASIIDLTSIHYRVLSWACPLDSTSLLSQRADTLLVLNFASQTIDTAAFRFVGESPNMSLQGIGSFHGQLLFAMGSDKIAFARYSPTSGVNQDLIPHMYFEKVFPNPASSILHVKIGRLPTADPNTSKLYMVDMLGRTVKHFSAPTMWEPSEFSFDVEAEVDDVPAGTYLLVIRNRGYTQSHRVSIMR